jgi:tRNA A37 threonylcarbamoyladenosine dehydratase
VAARTASAFNPNVHIVPIHGNIKDTQFDLAWFQGFDIVLNALDNLGMPHSFIAFAEAHTLACQMPDDTLIKCAWQEIFL